MVIVPHKINNHIRENVGLKKFHSSFSLIRIFILCMSSSLSPPYTQALRFLLLLTGNQLCNPSVITNASDYFEQCDVSIAE